MGGSSMKMDRALDIIESRDDTDKLGYMVSFEWRKNGFLIGDHFPEKNAGEKLIKDEETAWTLAQKFSRKMIDEVVNVYVIDSKFRPVKGYREKILNKYPATHNHPTHRCKDGGECGAGGYCHDCPLLFHGHVHDGIYWPGTNGYCPKCGKKLKEHHYEIL
jgi:hypothetical protein